LATMIINKATHDLYRAMKATKARKNEALKVDVPGGFING